MKSFWVPRIIGVVSFILSLVLVSVAISQNKEDPIRTKQHEKVWKEKYSIIHADKVSALALSPNDDVFATVSYGEKGTFLRFWKVQNGERISETEMPTAVEGLKFTPDGRFLAIGTAQKVILWDVNKKKENKAFGGLPDLVQSLDISRDGKRLAACDCSGRLAPLVAGDKEIGSVIVWDLDSGKQVFYHSEVGKSFNSVAFSPDGSLLAIGSSHPGSTTDPGEISIWKVAEEKLYRRVSPTRCGEIRAVAFSPDGSKVAGAGISNQKDGPPRGGTFLWKQDVLKGVTLAPELQSGGIWALAFSPTGKILVSGNKGIINSWDWSNGTFLNSAKTSVDWVGSITFSTDGSFLFLRGKTSGTVQVLTKQ